MGGIKILGDLKLLSPYFSLLSYPNSQVLVNKKKIYFGCLVPIGKKLTVQANSSLCLSVGELGTGAREPQEKVTAKKEEVAGERARLERNLGTLTE